MKKKKLKLHEQYDEYDEEGKGGEAEEMRLKLKETTTRDHKRKINIDKFIKIMNEIFREK